MKLSNNFHLSEVDSSVYVSKNGPKISHLLFVVDVLLFVMSKASHNRLVKDIFERFSLVAGLNVNLAKS